MFYLLAMNATNGHVVTLVLSAVSNVRSDTCVGERELKIRAQEQK